MACTVPQPALDALSLLCQHERVPAATAHELVNFLRTKQLLADLPSDRRMEMSPSTTVDQLWHALLLNTAERNTVEQALPGLTQVPHSTLTRGDREELKLQRMTVSMTAMHNLLGVQPQLELWQEAGCTLRSISAQVHHDSASRGLLLPIPVYVYDGATHDQHMRDMLSRLIGGLHDIQVLDRDGTPINNYLAAPLPYPIIHTVSAKLAVGTPCSSTPAHQPQPQPPSGAAHQSCNGSGAGAGAALLPQPGAHHPGPSAHATPSSITFVVSSWTGDSLTFTAGNITILQVKQLIQDHEGIDVCQQRLIAGGRVLEDDDMLADCVEDGGKIFMTLRMRGC